MTNVTHNVWIKHGTGPWVYRVPLALVAAEEIRPHIWRGELLVVLEGRDPRLSRDAFEFSTQDVPEEIRAQPAEFMLQELLRRVDGVISDWRFRMYEQSGLTTFLDPIPLEDGTRNDLYRVKIGGRFDTELAQALNECQIGNLRTLLGIANKITSSIRAG